MSGTEEDAIDRILTKLENEVQQDVANRIQQHRSGRSPKSSHYEAIAAIQSLLAEARKETVEVLKPYLGTDLTVTGIAMLEKVLKSLTTQGGKSDE